MRYLLGLDIGTSGAKAVLCDEDGKVRAGALAEYPLSSPRPLWSEQDPADWWHAAVHAIRTVLREVDGAQVASLGLTGQMHGATFLDANDGVIRPAILWNDQRTAAQCAEITERVGARRLIEIAGNPALTGFQAPKILWVRRNEPDAYRRVAHILLPKDYIRLKLTGTYASDASDSAGTLLLDLAGRNWSAELLQSLDIPREWLPQVFEGPEVTGALLPAAADEIGLPRGLPVVAGGGDNAAAAVGTGIVRSGVISSSIGTSGVLFAHSDEIALDPQGRLHTFCHAVPGKYHLMAVELAAGGSFQWFRNTLHQIGLPSLSYDDLTGLAAQAPIGAEGLIFLPYLTGERTPHLDPLARGAFVGLTSRHTVAHMARAIMEGVVFALRDGLELMRGLGLPLGEVRATGGGGRSPLWRQMQANIYGAEVVTLAAEEGPAYGAALLAGVGLRIFPDVAAAVDRCVAVGSVTAPDPGAQARYDEFYGVFHDLYGSLRDSMHRLSSLSEA